MSPGVIFCIFFMMSQAVEDNFPHPPPPTYLPPPLLLPVSRGKIFLYSYKDRGSFWTGLYVPTPILNVTRENLWERKKERNRDGKRERRTEEEERMKERKRRSYKHS